ETVAAAEVTLASVAAQTRKPDEVLLISSAATPRAASAAPDAVEIVRPEAEQSATATVNRLAGRMIGSHLFILRAGVTLAAETLAWFEAAIPRTNAVIVYCDEEIHAHEGSGGEPRLPLFRPAFDYDLLLQRNYIGEAFCIARQAYIELKGLDGDPSLDAHYDFLFRVLARFGPAAFVHLPQLLVCRPADALQSRSDAARDRTLRTVERHLERIGSRARAVPHADAIGRAVPAAVKILWPEDRTARISVIVPTRDSADMVFALISSLRRHAADWDLVEVIVVVNGSLDARSRFAFAEVETTFGNVRLVYREVPFNWAGINNTAVREISGDTLLAFLNDDMVCLTDHWDMRLRGQLARPEIGVVGGRLLYPNGALQHAGIAFTADGMTAHEAMGDAAEDGLYLDRTLLVHEAGAVTGAFFACRRELFDALGGFDAQRYAITSSDADLCVRVRAAGRSVIYDPFLTWIHYESVSRGQDAHEYTKQLRAETEHEVWRSRFPAVDRLDLSVNPHLARSSRPFVAFHRCDKEAIELWLEAQKVRCERWQRATGCRPAGMPC
ncbi:MAG TPA: glycosyltransferase, partial [Stellaceae bacterium]|nr:glycosyltransferase [Stellaceae bacterium]